MLGLRRAWLRDISIFNMMSMSQLRAYLQALGFISRLCIYLGLNWVDFFNHSTKAFDFIPGTILSKWSLWSLSLPLTATPFRLSLGCWISSSWVSCVGCIFVSSFSWLPSTKHLYHCGVNRPQGFQKLVIDLVVKILSAAYYVRDFANINQIL